FRKAGGYCTNKEVYPYNTNNRLNPKPCDNFKPKLTIANEERENIGKVLKDIRKSLKEISQVFKESENQS
ncbi:MAG: hypothetical protein K2N33_03060, partial [Clostridia bacterium]|nr:hypothetical protein [Clostridia bacterium]